jgi:rare lipoprotein A
MLKHRKGTAVFVGMLSSAFLLLSAGKAQAGSVWATVYHRSYHEGTTANGERFNYNGSSTAASSIFRIGTVLRVFNRHGEVRVRINDTCPSCELDLPLGAAKRLGGHPNWSGSVRVERLN